jgi:hypothetical protein
MKKSAVADDSLQQFSATGMLPDSSAMQGNSKPVNEAQLQGGGGGGSGSGAQIHVRPSSSLGSYANAQIHQMPSHQQGRLGHQQSQLQGAGSGGAIGTNVLFGDNSGFAGTRVGIKRGLEAVED